METNKKIQALEKHLNLVPTDFKGWLNLFDEYDKLFLATAQKEQPNSIIRSPNADIIAAGLASGLGGSVPPNWDGTVYDWNGRRYA